MEEMINVLKESEEEIQKIENERINFKEKYLKEKRDFFRIVRGDFLTGGIVASSLFLIINSLINFFGILFPYDLSIGIVLFIIGLVILISPVARPKVAIRKFNRQFLNVIYKFLEKVNQTIISFKREIDTKISDKSKFNDPEFIREIVTLTNEYYNTLKMAIKGFDELRISYPHTLSKKLVKFGINFMKSLVLTDPFIQLIDLAKNSREFYERKDNDSKSKNIDELQN